MIPDHISHYFLKMHLKRVWIILNPWYSAKLLSRKYICVQFLCFLTSISSTNCKIHFFFQILTNYMQHKVFLLNHFLSVQFSSVMTILKTKTMASGPIISWQINGETVEPVRDFIFLGSKITVDGDYSHEIKRCLLLGRKVMTSLESILKSRDITLTTKLKQWFF